MRARIDAHLGQARSSGERDRRNGSFRCYLVTAFGDLQLSVQRNRRALRHTRYRFLILDGVALGVRSDGRREVIVFQVAHGREPGGLGALPWRLWRCGLEGQGLETIACDGGMGLVAALPLLYPQVLVQRCWAHKTKNVYAEVRQADRPAVKRDLHAVVYAGTRVEALAALRIFAARWGELRDG